MRSGFFNSNITGYNDLGNPIYDRAEEASFFAEFFAAFIGNGVYPNPSTGMQVVENSTLGVLVKPGKCFINGYFGKVVPGGEEVKLEAADANLPRIDRVVARWNLQERDVNLHVLKGVVAVNPVAPELTRNSNVYELGIADVRIEKGVSVVTQANITDTRLNTSLCGIVAGVVQQLDTSTLFNQYLTWFEERKQEASEDYEKWFHDFTTPSEAEFSEWFENVRNQLSEDAAGNLQNEIDDLSNKMSAFEESVKGEIAKIVESGERWKDVLERLIGKKLLCAETIYDNSRGTSGNISFNNIKLTDYSKIEIFYKSPSYSYCNTKTFNIIANDVYGTLDLQYAAYEKAIGFYVENIRITSNGIYRKINYGAYRYSISVPNTENAPALSFGTEPNNALIYKVVLYKEMEVGNG